MDLITFLRTERDEALECIPLRPDAAEELQGLAQLLDDAANALEAMAALLRQASVPFGQTQEIRQAWASRRDELLKEMT